MASNNMFNHMRDFELQQMQKAEAQERRSQIERLADESREYSMPPIGMNPRAFVLTEEQRQTRQAIELITKLGRNLRITNTASMILLGVALGGIASINAVVSVGGVAGMVGSLLYARWCVARMDRTVLGPRLRF